MLVFLATYDNQQRIVKIQDNYIEVLGILAEESQGDESVKKFFEEVVETMKEMNHSDKEALKILDTVKHLDGIKQSHPRWMAGYGVLMGVGFLVSIDGCRFSCKYSWVLLMVSQVAKTPGQKGG